MTHTARKFFVEVVLPSYREFYGYYCEREVGLRQDVRNAGAAAEALLHLPDHLFNDSLVEDVRVRKFENVRGFRKAQWTLCPEYEYVCDFANVWKHSAIRRDGRKLNSMKDVQEIIGWIRLEDSEGYYYYSRKLLGVLTSVGPKLVLENALSSAFIFWTNFLVELEVIPCHPDLPNRQDWYLSRAEVAGLKPIKVRGLVGEYLHVEQASFVYRPDSHEIGSCTAQDYFEAEQELEWKIGPSPFGSGESA